MIVASGIAMQFGAKPLFSGAPVKLRALSRLLEYALALSAWKQAGGARWALRVNPSSGNLRPTEGQVPIGGIVEPGEAPGLCHYVPAAHGLERRADCPEALPRPTPSAYDSPQSRAPGR